MNTTKPRQRITGELARHAPFTAAGTLTGVIILVVIILTHVSSGVSSTVFSVLHPSHVVLSALATTGMYRLHGGKARWALLVGYGGSIGIATLSDIVLPYLGGTLVGAEMEFHVGFIEEWWLINPLALAGIAVGCWRPMTKFPHLGHVLLSTWASLFYLTGFGAANWLPLFAPVFLILFVAVWLPCCLSDIVFPLLFARGERQGVKLVGGH